MGDFQRGLTIVFVLIGVLALLSHKTNAHSPDTQLRSIVA